MWGTPPGYRGEQHTHKNTDEKFRRSTKAPQNLAPSARGRDRASAYPSLQPAIWMVVPAAGIDLASIGVLVPVIRCGPYAHDVTNLNSPTSMPTHRHEIQMSPLLLILLLLPVLGRADPLRVDQWDKKLTGM